MKNGFSLIELLLVLGLIALLATFAYPSYNKHLIRTKRLDGQTALLDLAARLEQYHQHTGTYQTATLATGKKTDVLHQNTSSLGYYQLKILYATEDEYQLEAVALGIQAKQDNLCAHLILNHLGHQTEKACWALT